MMILGPFLLLICAVTLSQEQETGSCSLAQELNNYCDARCNRHGGNSHVTTGPRGPVGKAGPKGERGSRGQKGDEGTIGPKGHKGILGPKGKKGTPGRKGDRGQEGTVNYTAVEEMIATAVSKAYQQLKEKAMNTTEEDGWMVFQRRQDGSVDFYRTPLPITTQTPLPITTALSTTSDGWTVFQRRQDGSVDFYRTWTEYVNGFGDANREFWMGLEKLHRLTSSGNYQLRIDLEDWEGNSVYAQYPEFSVGSASTNYRLTVSGYSGTAGDSLVNPTQSNWIHNGMAFSTKDSDNDLHSSENCAEYFKGAWWYNSCFEANLNGVYHRGGKYSGTANGIVWYAWKKDWRYSMKFVEMKLRPVQ